MFIVRMKSWIRYVHWRTQFSSVSDGIYAFGKSHMSSTPSLRNLSSRLWNRSDVGLVDGGPFPSFQGRSPSVSSIYTSFLLLQAIDGLVSSAVCSQVETQASQHLRSSETHVTRNVCSKARRGSEILTKNRDLVCFFVVYHVRKKQPLVKYPRMSCYIIYSTCHHGDDSKWQPNKFL